MLRRVIRCSRPNVSSAVRMSPSCAQSHSAIGEASVSLSIQNGVFHPRHDRSSRRSSTATTTTTSKASTESTIAIYEGMPRYPQWSVVGTLRGLDYMGTVSFAISGCMTAAACGLDALGCTAVGTITALGGGTARDILWGKLPVFWLDETEYVYMSMVTAFTTFCVCCYVNPTWPWFDSVMWWTDTVGLGAFAVIGTMFGVRNKLSIPLVLLGTLITCTGGGIARDLICRRPVRIMHTWAETYAITTILGGVAYLATRQLGLPLHVRILSGIATTVSLRIYAATFDWKLPVAAAMNPPFPRPS